MNAKNVVVTGVAVGLTAAILSEAVLHPADTHNDHTPATSFATLVSTSTSVAVVSGSGIFAGTPFRAYYPQAIEILADEVSEHIPGASVAFVLP